MVSKLRKLATGAAATAGLLLCQAALATPLTLSIPALGLSCVDGTACDTNDGLNNIVTWSPVLPGFSVSTFTAFSNNPGSTVFNILDITWSLAALNGATGGPLTILASQDNFGFPVGSAILQSVCSGDVLNGNVTCQEWVNLANTLNGLGPVTPGAQGPFTAPFSNTAFSGPYVSVNPNAITDRLIFNLGTNSTSTGDLRSITPAPGIPEPATLALVGVALTGLAFSRRRKQS